MASVNKLTHGAGGGENPPSNNLWIGNIASDVSDAELKALFENHGKVDSITSYPSRNYAFLYFKDVDGAKSAKQSLQGHVFHGMPLKIEFAKPAKPCKTLWVSGISQSVPKEETEKEFLRFGKIQEIRFLRDRSTAYIDYVRLEDATQALKSMNGKRIGGGQIRVDFLRSQPSRREQGPDAKEGQFFGRNMVPADYRWMQHDSLNHFTEPSLAGSKRPHQFLSAPPSRVLMISHPPGIIIEEDMLHNAMILFGEIERIKTFPDRNYAFVEFRSVEEATRAKEGLQGKLFNDSRIVIEFSNNEFPISPEMDVLGLNRPGMPGNNPLLPPVHGLHGPDLFIRPPLGPHGAFEPSLHGPEFSPMGGPNWRRSSPTHGVGSSPSAVLNRPVGGAWDVIDSSQIQRDVKRSRFDPSLPLDRAENVGGYGKQYGLPLRRESDWIWRGLITKCGTPVCRARCVPIGEGIGADMPDMVDCSARTGLDMLTKHYEDAIGFNAVFFLPDSEEDFDSYTEFLRFLGSRNRAGVAKFNDGTTLFLVPPSDFLTKVLKLSGPERLYGVVLNFPQATSSIHPPHHADPNKTMLSQTGYSAAVHHEEKPLPLNNNNPRGPHKESVFPPKPPGFNTESSFPPHSVPQPAVSLTPELIATLTSLLPANNNNSNSLNVSLHQPSPVVPVSNFASAPETNIAPQWNQESQQYQQGNYYEPVTPYGQGQMYERPTNLPPQQYHQGNPHDVYYGAHGSGNGADGSRFYNPVQQSAYPVLLSNQVQGSGASQPPQGYTPQPAEVALTHQSEQLQNAAAPYGDAQEGAESEADKNERYKSTLLFAANLLSRIHQPPGNQSGQGAGGH